MKTYKNEPPFRGQGFFNPGMNVFPTTGKLGFEYGADCFGPEVENRTLDAIRKSLADPTCDGPEIVYSIAMDVGKNIHKTKKWGTEGSTSRAGPCPPGLLRFSSKS